MRRTRIWMRVGFNNKGSLMRSLKVSLVVVGFLAGCSGGGGEEAGTSSSSSSGAASQGGSSSMASSSHGSSSASRGQDAGHVDAGLVDSGSADAAQPRCGDSHLDQGEQCDDGNTVTETCQGGVACTVCTSDCRLVPVSALCGNGAVDQGEECDDGNHAVEECAYGVTSCQVCGAACAYTAGMTSYCGDGNVNPSEVCDDGNTVAEACAYGLTSCAVCGPLCTTVPGATSYCGDNLTNGPETCDDGNTATEACTYGLMSCTVCDATCASIPGAVSYCGDGAVNGPEACDDHNTVTEECTYGLPSCTVCDSTCHSVAGHVHVCGDGLVDVQETCDDHNTADGDGCDHTCHVEDPWTCTGAPSVCSVGHLTIFNNTSFFLVQLAVDGVEYIPQCGTYLGRLGDPNGNDAPLLVRLGMTHTVTATSGAWQGDSQGNCLPNSQRIVYETFGPFTVDTPTTAVVNRTLTNSHTLNQYLTPTQGAATACWWTLYNDGANTREARFRFNRDGSWQFRELYNVGGATIRGASSPANYTETQRLLTHTINFTVGSFSGRYDEAGGLYITNGARRVGASYVYDQPYQYYLDTTNAHCP